MHRVQNNWRSIKANPRPCFWSKVNEPSIPLATISCYNWLFVCVQVLQSRSLFLEERSASNFHFEDLFFAQAQLCKTSHFTSLCSSQSAVFALCPQCYICWWGILSWWACKVFYVFGPRSCLNLKSFFTAILIILNRGSEDWVIYWTVSFSAYSMKLYYIEFINFNYLIPATQIICNSPLFGMFCWVR